MTLNPSAGAATFSNPVAPDGEDPWVTQRDGMYYYVFSTGPNHTGEYSRDDAVWVRGSSSLVDVFTAEPTAEAWAPPEGTEYSHELWAPELHWLEDAWYIYVAADDGNNVSHRTHVLRRTDADPRGPFEHLGELMLPDNKWAIDGTALQLDGQLYHLWSGWPGDRNEMQALYICRMKDPVTPVGERVMISKPELPWELRGGGPGLPTINEGPSAFTREGRTFVTYAASGSWSDFYCVGLLELVGEDPMDPAAWKKHEAPLLQTGNGAVAPGHPSVVKSPDGQEWWIVYHTAKGPGAGWDRQVNMQQLTFDENGVPAIAEPARPGESLAVPSGEKGSTSR